MTRLPRPLKSQSSDDEERFGQVFRENLLRFLSSAEEASPERRAGGGSGATPAIPGSALRGALAGRLLKPLQEIEPDQRSSFSQHHEGLLKVRAVLTWVKEKLPPQTYRCFQLALEGRTVQEIATLLEISPATVSSHILKIKSEIQGLSEEVSSPKSSAAIPGEAGSDDLEAEINSAYEEIGYLSHLTATPQRDASVESTFIRLRELQHREAEQFRGNFEARLGMPLDAGAKILERSRYLRKKLEDLGARDSSTEEPSST